MEKNQIKNKLLKYVLEKSDVDDVNEIPLDKSLLISGILDSFAVVELIIFIESEWRIVIEDSDFTAEKMGSINKMVNLINLKTN